MKKGLKYIFIVVSAVFLAFSANTLVKAQDRTDRVLIIEPQKSPKSYQFGASENVEVRGDIASDVYVMGKSVVVNGNVTGDLIVLGGSVLVNGNVSRNIIAVGGDVGVSGKVGQNIVVLSGSMNLASNSTVAGGILGAAGKTVVSGPVAGEIKMLSGEVDLSSSVGGNVETMVENINLSKEASISGTLNLYSENNANVAEGASVSGGIQKHSGPKLSVPKENVRKAQTTGHIISFLGKLVVGLVLLKLFEGFVTRVSEKLRSEIWGSTLSGLVILFLTPVICLFILITIIGAPLAFVTLGVYLITIYLSKLFVSYALGCFVFKIKNKYLALTAGLAVVYIVTNIQVLGGLAGLWITTLGLGSVWLYAKSLFVKAK